MKQPRTFTRSLEARFYFNPLLSFGHGSSYPAEKRQGPYNVSRLL
jgi:hypothetical protein